MGLSTHDIDTGIALTQWKSKAYEGDLPSGFSHVGKGAVLISCFAVKVLPLAFTPLAAMIWPGKTL